MLSSAVMKGIQNKCMMLEEAIEEKDQLIENMQHEQEQVQNNIRESLHSKCKAAT